MWLILLVPVLVLYATGLCIGLTGECRRETLPFQFSGGLILLGAGVVCGRLVAHGLEVAFAVSVILWLKGLCTVVAHAGTFKVYQASLNGSFFLKMFAWTLMLVLVVMAGGGLPVLVQGARMAGGNYPSVFYNVDSAFYLTIARMIDSGPAYPKESLEVKDFMMPGYHVGVNGLAVALHRITSMSLHSSLLLAVPLLMLACSAICVMAFIRALPGAASIGLFGTGLLALLYFWIKLQPHASILYWLNPVNLMKFPQELYANDYWFNTFPSVSNLTGESIFLFFLTSCVFAGSHPSFVCRFGVISCVAVAIYKAPFGGMLVGTFGLLSLAGFLLRLGGTRRSWLLYGMLGAVLAATLYVMVSHCETVSSTFTVTLPSFSNAVFKKNYSGWSVIAAVAVVVLLCGCIRKNPQDGSAVRCWSFAFPRLAFAGYPWWLGLLLVSMIPLLCLKFSGVGTFSPYLYCLMVPGLAVICISLIVTVFPVLSTWQLKLILLAATIYASFPSACSVLATSIHLMRDPSAGYEYVDNRPLAEALLHIPVEGALLATNDIRYPAENYLRKERQYQFAALFGHRNFGTDLSYLNPPENLVRRARFVTRVLDNENPGKDDLDVLVNKYGITHFVIHKRDEKKHNLPFQMIFENSKYAVYYTQGKGLL